MSAFTKGFYDAAHNHSGHVNLMVGNLFSLRNSKSKYMPVHHAVCLSTFSHCIDFVGKCYRFVIRKVQVWSNMLYHVVLQV